MGPKTFQTNKIMTKYLFFGLSKQAETRQKYEEIEQTLQEFLPKIKNLKVQ